MAVGTQFVSTEDRWASADESQEQGRDSGVLVCQLAFPVYLLVNFFYTLENKLVTVPGILAALTALVLVLFPRAALLLALACALHLAEILSRTQQSNHLLISAFCSVGLLFTYVSLALRQKTVWLQTQEIFVRFGPLGRWLLIIMYFYGVFHKLNTDFLNPDVSCGAYLWRAYNLPFGLSEWRLAQYGAIYGTLVVETVSALCLVVPRYRHIGIIIGVGFHWIIGFNDFDLGNAPNRNYLAFSVLSIFLHTLFLPRAFLPRLHASSGWAAFNKVAPTSLMKVSAISIVVFLLLKIGIDVLWFTAGATFVILVMLFGQIAPEENIGLTSNSIPLNLLVVLFLLNGFLPYTGFKTGQAIAMFSNLTTEGGESNHLVFRKTLDLFPHQSRIAIPISSADNWLKLPDGNYGLVEWSLLDRFERMGRQVTYSVDGRVISLGENDRAEVAANLAPRWVRQIMPFKLVNLNRPRTCDRVS